jgi:hypothetical protein
MFIDCSILVVRLQDIFLPEHRCFFRPINVSPLLRSIAFSILQALTLYESQSKPWVIGAWRNFGQLGHDPVPQVVLSTKHGHKIEVYETSALDGFLYHHLHHPLHHSSTQIQCAKARCPSPVATSARW